MSKLKEIRARCLDCVEGPAEVRNCTHFGCPLWAFRMEANPFLSVSESQRAGYCRERGYRPAARRGAGVTIEVLQGWAGRSLMMGSVQAPDPRQMTTEELTALGCTRLPAGALREHDWERDHDHAATIARKQRGGARNLPEDRPFSRRLGLEATPGALRASPSKKGRSSGGFSAGTTSST